MNVLWLSWKDTKHPLAGGAETISDELRKRLAADGHNVILITSRYPGSAAEESIDNVRVMRTGGRFSVYFKAFRLFRSTLKTWPDVIIDEMNTIPFGPVFYSRRKSILLTYQLARQVWFYQMIFPLSLIGYILEPIYLFIMSQRYKLVLTESESTKEDLAKYGFDRKTVKVFRIGIHLKPIEKLEDKKSMADVLVLGAIRPMKRTLSAVKGFEYARDKNPALTLKIAGDTNTSYGEKVRKYVNSSRHQEAITILGRVDNKKRLELMRSCSVILVTSIKEGWGLIVTEANSQGTPAITYDRDGLRDSVIRGQTGILVKSGDEHGLGMAINDFLAAPEEYEETRRRAWQSSKNYTFENCYADFVKFSGVTK